MCVAVGDVCMSACRRYVRVYECECVCQCLCVKEKERGLHELLSREFFSAFPGQRAALAIPSRLRRNDLHLC